MVGVRFKFCTALPVQSNPSDISNKSNNYSNRDKFETKDQEAYNKHSKEKHEFVCETCKESMNTKTELEKHIKDHHTRPCITCELEFKTISELKEHMKTSHGPECTICSKYFDIQDELEKHVAEKHNCKSQNKHTCNVRQESFESTEELGK
jgi:hypothetical protein